MKKKMIEFTEVWKGMSDEKTEEIKDNIKRLRKKSTKELIENNTID